MVKMAVFCPRLPDETESNWGARRHACRLYLRQLSHVEAVEFETLEQLQLQYPRQAFRRVLVAQLGYYPQAFWQWRAYQRVDVFDVLAQAGSPMGKALREGVHRLMTQEEKMRARFA